MQGVPPPIRDLELRDRLNDLLGEALSKPGQAATLYALRAFLRLVGAQGRGEVACDVLVGAVENDFREAGLGVPAMEAIGNLFDCQLLHHTGNGGEQPRVVPSEELRRELSAVISRAEAYCRALEALSRREVRPADEVERAMEQAACLFNEGLFFEVHEVLEAVWLKQEGQVRPLLQGLIQIAVGFHHLESRNLRGAVSLLREGLDKVKDYSPARFGLELDRFLQGAEGCARSIESLGRDAFDRFDRRMIPQMRLLR